MLPSSVFEKSARETCLFFPPNMAEFKLLKNITFKQLFKMPKHLQYTLYKNYTQKLNNHQIKEINNLTRPKLLSKNHFQSRKKKLSHFY